MFNKCIQKKNPSKRRFFSSFAVIVDDIFSMSYLNWLKLPVNAIEWMLNFSKRLVEHVNISRGGLFCFALFLLRHRPVLLFAGNIDDINNVTYSKIKSIFIGKIEDEYLNVCIAICTSKASGYRLQTTCWNKCHYRWILQLKSQTLHFIYVLLRCNPRCIGCIAHYWFTDFPNCRVMLQIIRSLEKMNSVLSIDLFLSKHFRQLLHLSCDKTDDRINNNILKLIAVNAWISFLINVLFANVKRKIWLVLAGWLSLTHTHTVALLTAN